MVNAKDKLRTLFEALLSVLPLSAQTIPAVGFMGFMVLPLLPYLLSIPFVSQDPNPKNVWLEFYGIWRLDNSGLLGGIIFYVGLVIFCVALFQWIWYHHKRIGLFQKGFYSKVRHPQFLGIIIMTLGLTKKELTVSIGWSLIGVPFLTPSYPVGVLELTVLWFAQVLGYIAIAVYEEWKLSKTFSEFKKFTQKVPLLLPVKNPKIIPEILFTVILIVGVCVILFLLPYNLIRILLH